MSPADASSRPAQIQPQVDRVVCGDARQILPTWPGELVDAIVTSPPYFQQRDYLAREQLGQESSPEAYVAALRDVLAECRRLLKSSGTLWLVIGDKYHNGCLLGMPHRVVLALIAAGWILRSDIIWHKPNAMPSPAKTRPTVDHEYIFLLTRSEKYFYDADAIREPHVTFTPQSRMRGGRRHFAPGEATPEQGKFGGQSNLHRGRWDQAFHPAGRNKRTVWSIPLSKSREAHFAVFPEALVATCLAAGSPPGGLVLDPFLGSGTTAVVAQRLGRRFLGIDCRADYCALARRRLRLEPVLGDRCPTTTAPPAQNDRK